MAFDILIGRDTDDPDAVPAISADPSADVQWLAACKVARHLRLQPPGRAPREVEAFIQRHLAEYLRHRRSDGIC